MPNFIVFDVTTAKDIIRLYAHSVFRCGRSKYYVCDQHITHGDKHVSILES